MEANYQMFVRVLIQGSRFNEIGGKCIAKKLICWLC